MKRLHLLAILLTLILLLGACGTIEEESESLMSVPEDESWEDLTPDQPSQTPETDTILPELDVDTSEGEKIVTGDYMGSVLGTWDNERKTHTYEFKSNENLVVTKNSSGASTNYTYWFREVAGQVQLCIFENGQEEATAYSFTLKSSTLTLYDIQTGDALEQLTRRVETTPTPKPSQVVTQAPAPSAVPSTAPSAEPTPSAVPSAVPSPEPSPVPSAVPSMEPSAEPTPSPSPAVEVPAHVSANMHKVECVLAVVDEGKAYNAADSGSFWSIMARYCSLSYESDDEGYLTLSGTQIMELALQVFPDVAALPDPPAGNLVQLLPAEDGDEPRYKLLWGAAWGHESELISYENGTLTIRLDGASTYAVVVNEDGTIASAAAVAAE